MTTKLVGRVRRVPLPSTTPESQSPAVGTGSYADRVFLDRSFDSVGDGPGSIDIRGGSIEGIGERGPLSDDIVDAGRSASSFTRKSSMLRLAWRSSSVSIWFSRARPKRFRRLPFLNKSAFPVELERRGRVLVGDEGKEPESDVLL